MRKHFRNWELSIIFVLVGCLGMSITNLLMHYSNDVQVISAMAAESRFDLYPSLYAPVNEEIVLPAGNQEKTVYFTFDDGPSPNTEKILDILMEEGIPATFFVSGQTADQAYSGDLLRRMVNEGHAVGLHSYTHNYGEIYGNAEDYLKDINRLREYILEETGIETGILRFPGGSATRNAKPEVMEEIIREIQRRGYVYFDWNVVSGDDTGEALPVQTLAENVLTQARDKDTVIVLCHDNAAPTTTPEATQIAIAALREQGYAFEKLTTDSPPIRLRKID